MRRIFFLLPALALWAGCVGAAQQSSYPTKATVVDGDKALITDSTASNATKQAAMSAIKAYVIAALGLPDVPPTSDNQIIQATGAGTSQWTSVIDGLINDAGTGTEDLLSASEINSRIATSAAAKENSLGNPSVNGYVLSSSTDGTRSWVEMTGGGTGISHAPSDGNYYASKDGGWSSLTGLYQPADADLSVASGASAAANNTYFGKDAWGSVGFHTLPSGGGSSAVVYQQAYLADVVLVADVGTKIKLPAGIAYTTAEIGCDASDTLGVSVKAASTVNGTYSEVGTVALTETASVSGVDISSWANGAAGSWIRIDLTGTPSAAKDCVIAIGGTTL